MSNYEVIWSFLREFFNYEHYKIAIEKAKKSIANNEIYQKNWQSIKKTIENRELLPGQPLKLVHESANQVLDDNSDNEAYVWLNKMIYNIEKVDGEIEEY